MRRAILLGRVARVSSPSRGKDCSSGRRDDRAPSIWKRVTQSANSDADYYWNTETNDTTWDLPEGEDLELIETIEA